MTEKCKAIFKGKDIPAAAYLLASAFLLIMLASRSSFYIPAITGMMQTVIFLWEKLFLTEKCLTGMYLTKKGCTCISFTAWLIWCLTLPLQACSSLKFCLRLLIWQESAGFCAFM